ncbi:MAG: hypothetical protein IPI26_09790 [Elusimicrobia bacterium]|nr:hypothetical protein [Elusimicrobiota bacterium]
MSEERANYGSGFQVVEINAEPGNAYIRFSNGEVLREGEERGGLRDDVWRLQIRHTVKKHLEKELQTRSRGIKVLSLFFIDRVSNYRDYDAEGKPVQGKLALAVEQCLAEFASMTDSKIWIGCASLWTNFTTGILPKTKRGC